MNIFVLNHDPVLAAQDLCNKHLSKMPLESVQMLYTAHYVLDGEVMPYKPTHANHPCSVWVRQSIENYRWLVLHGTAICLEYTKKYGKQHKCYSHLVWLSQNEPANIPKCSMTPFAMAFYKKDPVLHAKCFVPNDPVASYRNYYKLDKARFAKWDGRTKPYWW